MARIYGFEPYHESSNLSLLAKFLIYKSREYGYNHDCKNNFDLCCHYFNGNNFNRNDN